MPIKKGGIMPTEHLIVYFVRENILMKKITNYDSKTRFFRNCKILSPLFRSRAYTKVECEGSTSDFLNWSFLQKGVFHHGSPIYIDGKQLAIFELMMTRFQLIISTS